jgi:nucleotide-binding universal stress UspA family protein
VDRRVRITREGWFRRQGDALKSYAMPSSEAESVIVLCVDGSDRATEAVATGFELVRDGGRPLVVTVIEASDEALVSGGGHFGGVMSPEELEARDEALEAEGRAIAQQAATALGLDAGDIRVVRGEPGAALCALATELSARALVMGSRGRGGLKRALLGSVSDYVVRNAPCPVVITGATS